MKKSIQSRKGFILKQINLINENIRIEEELIKLENESIKKLIGKKEVKDVECNIGKKSLDLKTVIKSNIVTKEVNVDDISDEIYLKKRTNLSDEKFFEKIKDDLDNMPISNGCRYYEKIDKTIGIIADEFLMHSYEGAANFIYITPSNYKNYIEKLDLLLIVSAWKGLKEEWRGLANPKSGKREKALEIIKYCKQKGVKTVFYSKEDPVNYDRFIGLAKECEHIFTTCKEKISDYIKECNNNNVNCLTFSVNPVYHNPIGFRKYKKIDEVIFSGSWYEKYPHRIKDMRMIFDGVRESKLGLRIIDRNYELNLRQHFFPVEYLEHVSPSVNHQYLQKLHKMFNWAINFNSIKDSYTMFANRIYELQANGNALISNYSVGVNTLFPNVFLINNKSEVKEILDNFNEKDVYEHQVYGIRRVMTNETCYERISELLNLIGIKYSLKKRSILVVADKITENIKEMFEKQSFENKKLIEKSLVTKEILEEYDYITFFSDSKEYGRYYIQDMLNGFKYTNSDYITKESYYIGNKLIKGREHDYVNKMTDKYRTVFYIKSFQHNYLLDMENDIELKNGYSIDPFEFNDIKNDKKDNHKEYKVSLVIPTYNNGEHLMNKCFNSLRRSSIFNEIEIIIVDDGSTDGKTEKVVKYLEEKYKNVKAFLYDDNGSGSASRPRNKGVEIASCKYITFLDPDNEAINDGYAKLYDEISNNDYDMVVGNMLKVDLKSVMLNYYNTAKLYYQSDILDRNKKEYLVNTKFKGMSIQALMFKKEVVEKNNISQVIGAVGQDTLFFYELLLNSNKVKVINETIHIYYAAVEGSTVNNITKKYFEKALRIEKAKYTFFKKNKLLSKYLDKRYEFYFKNWYMKKLEMAKVEDLEECIELVKSLFRIYEKDIVVKDKDILQFINSK